MWNGVKTDVKSDIRIEYGKLLRSIDRMAKVSERSKDDINLDLAEFFIRSVNKLTPPAKGKANIPQKMYKRGIIIYTSTHRKRLKSGKLGKERTVKRYKVPYRTAHKKGRKYFAAKAEATAFAKIDYRGTGRAGWVQALNKLGFDQKNIKLSGKVMTMPGVNQTTVKKGKFLSHIAISNTASGIDKYSPYAHVQALRKTNNRAKFLLRKMEKELKEAFNK